jgi:hypothetical protein
VDDKLCFVQFLHPGGEHVPEGSKVKPWNRGRHQRKFLKSSGRYLDRKEVKDSEIVFWGEWEAESQVANQIEAPLPEGPHWVYEPYYVPPPSYRGLQNTDPFVFGEQFHYTGCLQHTKFGPTQMRHLSRGSVILFGSCLHRERFVLDTVFVVANHVDHSLRDYRARLEGRISETYEAVTIAPWYGNTVERDKSHRLYSGATYEEPVAGMFSFFPCLPSEASGRGFERPTIRIPGVITDVHNQGKKLNPQASTADVKKLWDEVVRQVTGQGLLLGVGATLPLDASTSATK